MAKPFLKLVAEHVYNNYKDSVENLCIVLPNKRGSLFLKQHLGNTFNKISATTVKVLSIKLSFRWERGINRKGF